MSKAGALTSIKRWAVILRDHCGKPDLAEALEGVMEVIAASRTCIKDECGCNIDCRKCLATSCPAYSATALLDEWEARKP